MVGHNKDAAELVKQCLELRAPHVFIVHNLFQVVMSSEIVKQSGSNKHNKQKNGFRAGVSLNH